MNISHKVTSTGNIFSIGYTHDEADFSDVVKIIRCKDCQYYCTSSDSINYCYIDGRTGMKPDDFCSYAQRKQEKCEKDIPKETTRHLCGIEQDGKIIGVEWVDMICTKDGECQNKGHHDLCVGCRYYQLL